MVFRHFLDDWKDCPPDQKPKWIENYNEYRNNNKRDGNARMVARKPQPEANDFIVDAVIADVVDTSVVSRVIQT